MNDVGPSVGPYRVLGRLGAGGMGEVLLAWDPRLEREVALKMLPREFAGDAEQLQRFRREALTLAAMNHPNIASIYGFEDLRGGGMALVLERVEGESLADRLARGALPMEDALQVCAQIAEALEVAHERGVMHRDLKPGNVMLAPRGLVKVLDFGLAKSTGGLIGLRGPESPEKAASLEPLAPPAIPAGEGPTPSAPPPDAESSSEERVVFPGGAPLTQHGMVLGTPGYMSPEQVLAGHQDPRTDLFAFGCVMFECLTGRRVFGGRTDFEVMAAVLYDEADLTALPGRTPARIRDLVGRCLEKDVERRWPDVRSARIEIEESLGVRRAAALRGGELAATPHNLPRLLTGFVGRGRQIEECTQLLSDTRLLTLTGVGGSGKTRLALRLAETLLDGYPDGAWFVDLEPLQEPGAVSRAVSFSLQVREEQGKTLTQSLVDHLAHRRVLLVLDNCENVREACAELAARLLQSCPEVRILATSREALSAVGETVYAVAPLELPPKDGEATLEEVAASESVTLFAERARLAQPGFTLSDESAPAVIEICRRLDGLPLAIELAAARIKMLSVEQIRSKLDDRFRLLSAGGPAAPARQRALITVIQWSYDHLANPEQRLLRQLSVFAGGWTFETSTVVCAEIGDEFEVLDLLTRLVERSLVMQERPEAGSSRYRLLESVHRYAVDRLDDAGEGPAVRERHLDLFLSLAEQAEELLNGPRQKEWLSRLGDEDDTLLGALAWCENASEGADKGLRLAASLSRFWSAQGHYVVGRLALEQSIGHAGGLAPAASRAKALVRAGGLALYQGDYSAARPRIEESLALYRSLNDTRGVARTLSGLSVVATYQGDYAVSRKFSEESLELYRAMRNRRGEAQALHNLGYVAVCESDYERAGSFFEEAVNLFREVGDRELIALSLTGMGGVLTKQGNAEGARSLLLESLQIASDLGAKRDVGYVFDGVAELATVVGDPTRGARMWGAAEAVRKAIGSPLLPGEQRERERMLERIRGALGSSVFDSARSAGRELSFEKAVAEALAWLEAGTSGSESAPGSKTAE